MRKAIVLLALLGNPTAYAAPKYYILTGKITILPTDAGGYAAAHDIRVGNTVNYVFVVDTDKAGFTKSQGTKTDKPDVINEGYHADYFFDSLVYASLFSPAVADSASGSYFGYHTTITSGAKESNTAAIQTIIGNADHNTQVIAYLAAPTTTVFLPVIGETMSVTENYVGPASAWSSASLTMKVTSIGDTRPVEGIASRSGGARTWLSATFRGNALAIENRSGRNAQATLMDPSGRVTNAFVLGERYLVPMRELPRGMSFLRVQSAGRADQVLRASLP